MKAAVLFLATLVFSVQSMACPYRTYRALRAEQATTVDHIASLPFGTSKDEIYAYFAEPDLVVPATQSLEGEIWAYRLPLTVYGFAFAFDHNGEVIAKRFDFEESQAAKSAQKFLAGFSTVTQFDCQDSSSLYFKESGATFPIFNNKIETIIWRASDFTEIKSRNIQECDQLNIAEQAF